MFHRRLVKAAQLPGKVFRCNASWYFFWMACPLGKYLHANRDSADMLMVKESILKEQRQILQFFRRKTFDFRQHKRQRWQKAKRNNRLLSSNYNFIALETKEQSVQTRLPISVSNDGRKTHSFLGVWLWQFINCNIWAWGGHGSVLGHVKCAWCYIIWRSTCWIPCRSLSGDN